MTIGVAETSLISAAAYGLIIWLGHPLSLPLDLSPKVLSVAVACALVLATYKILYGRRRKEYEAEFETYTKRMRVVGTISTLLFAVGSIQLALFAAVTAHKFR